ncbi:MAG: DNA polymerase III subunit alpha [Candidatus Shikimatogenerans sp. JK-2022]|nr:DNA polymerase III subunit alpha [Candidatus Shikimatogenerans bostrichidophilus]
MFLFLDTETTGLPINNIFKKKDIYKWPRLIQISWQMYNKYGKLIYNNNYYIKLKRKYKISLPSFYIHGINKKFLKKNGNNIKKILNKFLIILKKTNVLIGHNISYDINILISEYYRYNKKKIIKILLKKKKIDTQKSLIFYYNKWITLERLYNILYNNIKYEYKLHNAYIDINITILCFLKLIYYKILLLNYKLNILNFYKNIPLLGKRYNLKNKLVFYKKNKKKSNLFFNIHNHTHYNILNSTIKIDDLINKAIKYKMKAVGICDDNMMGVYNFISSIKKFNNTYKIKGIIGYNIYIKDNNNIFNHVLIAKNTIGYYNLIKISTHSFFYNSYKIDNIKYNVIHYIEKEIVKKYSKGLIFLTGNLNSEISYYIINNNIKKAEKILLYWKKIFKKNIYIEIFINNLKNEDKVNKILLYFSKKHNILYINQCDVYYLNKKDYIFHDILFCIKNKINFLEDFNKKNNKYIKKLPNKNFYFKSYINLKNKYKNFNKGFNNLEILLNEIKDIKFIKKDFLPKKFNLPKSFLNKYNNKKNINYLYLKFLTYKGAKKKYGKLNKKIILRIKKELKLIKLRNFTNYFLIVKDIINIAKKLKVEVGPGRGSVAGSIISYCINITRIDPLKYDLLFERFLNIYRKKMPDIDLDLNYKKRKKIINYIINKYGPENVSYIITYGKIGIKTAIRDCSRVFNLPLKNVNALSKELVKKKKKKKNPFKKKYKEEYNKYKKYFSNISYINKILNFKISLDSFILNIAKNLEGIIRNVGIHACGIIMSNVKLKQYVPLIKLLHNTTNKQVILTQYNAANIESLGFLKIDLLGLRTLAVIKESLVKIKNNKKKIKFNLLDKPTYTLFSNNQTTGIFQYESKGIRILACRFKPKEFKELIAFNALYRPGPIQYIPSYIERKNGREKVIYDLPIMKECLKDTYGITIYQEQVILLANIISGINQYEADLLREAIAKKNRVALINLKAKFFKNSLKKGYDVNILKKIWRDWESFASYAFNKSHATCYAYITFKTAYLKKHYKKEYLSSILNNYLQNREKLLNLLLEAKNMGIKFLLPDINISNNTFNIENKKYIRYSICGIKGIGEKSTKEILSTRSKKKFTSILDLLYRVNLRIVNKRLIKILIITGSFNVFGIPIYKYFIKDKKTHLPKIEVLIKEISIYKKTKNYNYLTIKNKYKNYFKFNNKVNDIEIINNNKEQINYLGINLIKDLYYKENKIFNILNLSQYKQTAIKNTIIYLSALIISNIYKYNNIYNIKLKDHNNYYNSVIKIFRISISNKKKLNKIEKIYKNNVIFFKILDDKIIDIKKLKNILNKIKIIYIKIYYRYYYNLYNIIINNIINKFLYVKKGKIKKILFKVYDINKVCIYKNKIFNIKLNIDILYKIKKMYPNIYIKI